MKEHYQLFDLTFLVMLRAMVLGRRQPWKPKPSFSSSLHTGSLWSGFCCIMIFYISENKNRILVKYIKMCFIQMFHSTTYLISTKIDTKMYTTRYSLSIYVVFSSFRLQPLKFFSNALDVCGCILDIY